MHSRLICAFIVALISLPAHAGEHILTPMLGMTNWADDSGHTARGTAVSFGDGNELTQGFRYLYMFDSGLAVGGDIYFYEKDVTTTSQANDAGVLHTHALVEYFFNPKGSVSPFVGGGIGFTAIGFNGGNLDDDGTAGLSYELNGGVLFRISEIVGLQLEYKYTDFEMDDEIDGFATNIDTTANSFLVGITIHI